MAYLSGRVVYKDIEFYIPLCRLLIQIFSSCQLAEKLDNIPLQVTSIINSNFNNPERAYENSNLFRYYVYERLID